MEREAQTRLSSEECAAFYRAALFLGLVRGQTVIDWADGLVASAPTPSHELIELAMTGADDVTALRHALLRLCDERESPPVIDAILGLIGEQYRNGRRSFEDTITVLRQMRGSLHLPPTIAEDLLRFEFRFRSASPESLPGLETELRHWLEGAGST